MSETGYSDEQFSESLRKGFTDFVEAQTEFLRLARHIRAYSEVIDSKTVRLEEELRRQLDNVDLSVVSSLEDFFSLIDGETTEDDLEVKQFALEALVEQIGPEQFPAYLISYIEANKPRSGTPMLLSSMLVSLVGALEIFVSGVIKDIYRKLPQSLNDRESSYTFNEISSFGNMDDFKDYVIEKITTDLLYSGAASWFEHLKKKFNLSVPKRVNEFETLELFQRRNVIVHNAGKVSQQYIDKLNQFTLDVSVGQELPVSDEYFERAADELYLVAFELFSSCIYNFCNTREVIVSSEYHFGLLIYRLLQHQRLELAKKAVVAFDDSQMMEERAYLMFKVNGWIAHKFSHTFEDCRSEVENFNVSARSNDFKLAKLALLDRNQEAYSLAMKMIEADELKTNDWHTWPLLKGVRSYASAMTSGNVEIQDASINSSEGDTMFDLDK